jgi:hypothetical protein
VTSTYDIRLIQAGNVIENILQSGVLSVNKKYFGLLNGLLELRGRFFNLNTLIDLSDKEYILKGSNQNNLPILRTLQ